MAVMAAMVTIIQIQPIQLLVRKVSASGLVWLGEGIGVGVLVGEVCGDSVGEGC